VSSNLTPNTAFHPHKAVRQPVLSSGEYEGGRLRQGQLSMEAICNVPLLTMELESQLSANNGLARFGALFDLNGTLVSATLIGTAWAILTSDDSRSRIITWFNASQARNVNVRLRHDAAKGYYVGVVLAPGKVTIIGTTPTTQRAAIVRSDGGFSRDVTVIDNGRQSTQS
jgi:hypothetical protein